MKEEDLIEKEEDLTKDEDENLIEEEEAALYDVNELIKHSTELFNVSPQILQALIGDEKKLSKEEVKKLVNSWLKKEVK